MKKLTLTLIALLVAITITRAQTPPQQTTPPKQRVIIQTIFGPKEMDIDQVPPGTSYTPVPSATTAPPPQAPPPANIPAAPAPQAPATPQQQDEDSPVLMTFDNATDIYQVIKIIGEALKLNYVIDPAVKGTININTAGPLKRSDLLPILETILRINGVTMIKTGNFYEIVPVGGASRQPLQLQERNNLAAPDDQMVLQIIRMKYVTAGDMSRLLSPYLSEGAQIVTHDSGSVLMVTERRSNLRKLLEIVDLYDNASFEGDRVRIYPIRNNVASEVVNDLKMIFGGYALSENTAIRFAALMRLNSIMVVTANPVVFPEVEKMLARLDQPNVAAGIGNYVYRAKNARAVDLQRVIAELYGSRVQLSSNYAPPAGVTVTPPGQAPTPPPAASPFGTPGAPEAPGPGPGAVAGAAAESLAGVAPNTTVRVIADENNNALVVQATPQTWAIIRRTLEDLDVLRRQVLIEAQIYEVVLDDSMSLGLSAMLRNRTAGNTTTASFVTPSGGGNPSLAASTFALIGGSRELVMFLNAQENRSRVRTLSAPSVLVSDNMTANFQVGSEVPIPTSTGATPVQSSGTNVFAQTIAFRNTGVIMIVKPLINEGGNVTLDISQEVSQAGGNAPGGVAAPVIGKSSVSSTIVVQDGQTVAISGFIRENNELARSRVPVIGRVPGLGILFGNTRKGVSRSELIVLITPKVLQTHSDADRATEELKEKLREVKKLLK
jgi:general secretion pathway protein D